MLARTRAIQEAKAEEKAAKEEEEDAAAVNRKKRGQKADEGIKVCPIIIEPRGHEVYHFSDYSDM